MSLSQYRLARTTGALSAIVANEAVPGDVIGTPIQTNSELDGPETPRVELVDITEKSKGYGDQAQIYLTDSLHQAKENRGTYDEFALLLRRKVDKEGDAISTTLEVQSPIIRSALRDVLATYSYLNLAAHPITIRQPYDALFHYRKELRQYAGSEERTAEEKLHMSVLTKFMELNLRDTEDLYEQLIPNGKITFPLLWTLFRAEDDVILQRDYLQECQRVIHCEEKTHDGATFFEIEAWRWGYNGAQFGPTMEKIRIPEFSSTRRITQLKTFPLKMMPKSEREELCAYLVGRGHQWKGYVNITHQQYTGPIWIEPPGDRARSMADLVITHESGRIILDHERHQQNNFAIATSLIGANGYVQPLGRSKHLSRVFGLDWNFQRGETYGTTQNTHWKKSMLSNVRCHDNDEHYVMTDEQALLCPARVRGFCLGMKKWAFFLIDEIQDIKWRDDAFDKLELDQTMKDTIEALIRTHSLFGLKFEDFVADKGKGLVMLLHGPPGAGKTLTAESIAETSHKPLYIIGTGELGTAVEYTEPTLIRIFDLAKNWNAILLLDEADLFLSKRTRDDVKRNAFVTIFLRLLEYYQGILFLTTNRVEEFDPAFKSRIHLSVEYHALDQVKRASIWRNLLEQIDHCRKWDQATYNCLGVEFDLNGREIKNLIKVAQAISAYKKEPLTLRSLRLVYSINYGGRIPSQTEPKT